jgi:hypothetical protein
MKKILILITLAIATSTSYADCNLDKKTELAVRQFEVNNIFQLYLSGSMLECEAICYKKLNCITKCQNNQALKLTNKYLENNKHLNCFELKSYVKRLVVSL